MKAKGKDDVCVEFEANVPMGCEAGGPIPRKYLSAWEKFKREWELIPILICFLGIPVMVLVVIIYKFISAVF